MLKNVKTHLPIGERVLVQSAKMSCFLCGNRFQEELRGFCKKRGIQFEAWSPLMQGQMLDHQVLKEIADKYRKSAAQVVLRWDLQHGVVTIP